MTDKEPKEPKDRPLTPEEQAIVDALHGLYVAKNFRGIVSVCGRVVSVRLAAHILGITKRHLNDYIKSGRLPSERIGNEAVVRLADLFALDRRPWTRKQ